MNVAALEPNVTVCPPGKRAGKGVVLRGPVLSTVPLTTLTALERPSVAGLLPTAKGDRRPLQDRIDEADRADAMAVALAQPHRQGSDSKRVGEALYVFCKRLRLRHECYRAGHEYGLQVRTEKTTRKFFVEGRQPPPTDTPMLTEAEETSKREGAIAALAASNTVLRAVHPNCPRLMLALCFADQTPGPYDDGKLIHGMLNLSRHYGKLNEGINRGKAI